MKIDFMQTFKTLEGKEMLRYNRRLSSEGEIPPVDSDDTLTLKHVCCNALLAEDDKADGKEKARRYKLAIQIYDAKEALGLPIDDIAIIKKLIGKIYPPIIVGQAFDIFDRDI
jgi:hypothetical protein